MTEESKGPTEMIDNNIQLKPGESHTINGVEIHVSCLRDTLDRDWVSLSWETPTSRRRWWQFWKAA